MCRSARNVLPLLLAVGTCALWPPSDGSRCNPHAGTPQALPNWTIPIEGFNEDGASISPTAITSAGIILVPTLGHLYALDSDGTVVWSLEVPHQSCRTPAINNDDVVFVIVEPFKLSGGSGSLYALKGATGAVQWHVTLSARLAFGGPPVKVGLDAVFVQLPEMLVAFEQTTGQIKWKHSSGAADPAARRFLHVTESNVLATVNATVYSLSIADGSVSWSHNLQGDLKFTTSSIRDAKRALIYVGASNPNWLIAAIDENSGDVVWRRPGGYGMYGAMIVHGDTLVFDQGGLLTAVNLADSTLPNLWVKSVGTLSSGTTALSCGLGTPRLIWSCGNCAYLRAVDLDTGTESGMYRIQPGNGPVLTAGWAVIMSSYNSVVSIPQEWVNCSRPFSCL